MTSPGSISVVLRSSGRIVLCLRVSETTRMLVSISHNFDKVILQPNGSTVDTYAYKDNDLTRQPKVQL